MLYDSKVTRQGQITLPKPVRDKYMIREGDKVTYIDLGDHLLIIPALKDPLQFLKDLAIDDPREIKEIKREIHHAAASHVDEPQR